MRPTTILRRIRTLFREPEWQRMIRIGRVSVGRGTYGQPNVISFATDETRLFIGSFVSIANDVTFVLGGNHPSDRVTTFPIRHRFALDGRGSDGYPSSRGDIVIGSDVWLGHGSVILSGVTIGTGAVIGAGSVVTRDIPPYAIAVGNPARVHRFRFDDRQISDLMAIRWWEWPTSLIIDRVDDLSSPDVETFIDRYGRVDSPKSGAT